LIGDDRNWKKTILLKISNLVTIFVYRWRASCIPFRDPAFVRFVWEGVWAWVPFSGLKYEALESV
jgi:hypothetical protein